jgi:hypothetical protein
MRVTLLSLEHPTVHHAGGGLAFDAEGALLVGLGDGGLIGDRHGWAQDPGELRGSILRLVLQPGTDAPLAPAPGNPFVAGGGRPEVLVKGVRNPYRIDLDQATGNLWVADVGHDCAEEVSVVRAGSVGPERAPNLGWNRYEGHRRFVGGEPANYVAPVLAYPHGETACAVVGGAVVADPGSPIHGRFVFSDYCGGRLLAVAGDGSVVDLGPRVNAPTGVHRGPGGAIWITSAAEGVLELVPA